MFKYIMVKEMINSVYDFRFFIALTLCLIFIPLGFYITFSEYEHRFSDYNNSVSMYNERVQGTAYSDIPVEGFRPPSPLSVLSIGLEKYIPNKVITSRDGLTQYVNERGINNPVSLLFGDIDFLVNISVIMSLLALIFSYNIITGEKERGTLSQIVSNPVSRTKLLLAKTTGSFLMLLIALTISIIVGILIVVRMGDFHLLQGENQPKFITVLVASILYVFCIFNLGILISTWTRRPVTSIIVLLLIWLVYVIAIPKLSPLIAQMFYPVRSQEVVNIEKQLLMSNLNNELNKKRQTLYNDILREKGVNTDEFNYFGQKTTDTQTKALEAFEEQRDNLENEYSVLITSENEKIDTDYRNQRQKQITIAMNLSRLSPVSCFNYIVSELSGTGIHEIDNFIAQSQRFQAEVKTEIYDKYPIRNFAIMSIVDKPKDRSKVLIPQLSNYKSLYFTQILIHIWMDMFLIIIYIILFFSLSYVRFLRYDVR